MYEIKHVASVSFLKAAYIKVCEQTEFIGAKIGFPNTYGSLPGDDGKPSLFAPVMLATLSTCAQLERDNITFRLQSGRKQYISKGDKLGRKPGSKKSADQKKEEYKDAIALLKKGYAIRNAAKLTGKGISTIQRVKKEFG